MTGNDRARLLALDRCLQVLENALLEGQQRVNAPLANSLRNLLGEAGLVPDHRLEGRRTERVLDDIFALQAKVMGVDDEQHVG
jgi:hypothetical protein